MASRNSGSGLTFTVPELLFLIYWLILRPWSCLSLPPTSEAQADFANLQEYA